MKKVLLLTLPLLLVANVSMANHFGIYTDATGSSCEFGPGFNPNVTIIEKFSTGSTGARFRMDPGASAVFGFNTPFVPVGQLTTDLSLGYGQCLNGAIVLGTAIMNLVPGLLHIRPAEGFASIIYTNCIFAELPASGGSANIGGTSNQCPPFAVEAATWGKVKELYR